MAQGNQGPQTILHEVVEQLRQRGSTAISLEELENIATRLAPQLSAHEVERQKVLLPLRMENFKATMEAGQTALKTDREGKVRCECTLEAGGFRYEGKLYNSLSGVAAAAAKDLKLSGTSFNGYVFWGLKPSSRDPLHRVEHLWQRYSNAAAQLLKAGGPEKTAALDRLRQHAAQIKAIAG
jgi:DUF2924 family protein